MQKNLVIVESPAKAKTIEKFLGKDYTVKSSFGHIRDLSKKDTSIDVAKGFKPKYEIPEDKVKIVNELKKLSKEAEVVWLASDEDREGEAIAWHLKEALDLDESKTKRIVFNEITKNAIIHAVENPRNIDINLVNAQQARRILDRLVGYEISPVLWRKVKPSLSAGRVQSVAVRLIVEREEEIKNFKAVSFFKVVAVFDIQNNNKTITAELSKRFEQKQDAQKFLEDCIDAQFAISNIEKKPGKKSPAPPFTTSTLQQEASRKLGFPVAKTMMVAQQLYESGHITYMRTDSVNLSDLAISMTKEEIIKNYGEKYSKTRKYTNKIKGAQEAHEAIRPTYMDKHEVIDADSSQRRLYDLIWKRTIASQMSDAQLERTDVTIDISKRAEKFVAQGEIIQFDGFLKVYMESVDDENEEDTKGLLPPLSKGQELLMQECNAVQNYTQHPPRYTEASLVKKLEELGIGRPSTYAPTISTIQKREYVVKEDREKEKQAYVELTLKDKKVTEIAKTEKIVIEKGKLFPTDIGGLVNKFLMQYFTQIMDYHFTADIEVQFDDIAQGKLVWAKMLEKFYEPFHKQVVETSATAERFSGERLIGVDPKTKHNVYAKIGRFGPMVQIGDTASEEKPRFASLKKSQSIEQITLEEALSLFDLPRIAGRFEDEDMVVTIGRFGPYIKHDEKSYSLGKTDDPYVVGVDRCIEIIRAKRVADAQKEKMNAHLPKVIGQHQKEDITANLGRFGPYLTFKGKNYRVPKTTDILTLSLEGAIDIVEGVVKQDNTIKIFPENDNVKVLNGRYGAYISIGKKNYKIPKEVKPEYLTLKQCLEIAEEADAKKK